MLILWYLFLSSSNHYSRNWLELNIYNKIKYQKIKEDMINNDGIVTREKIETVYSP